jgi:hypothetical protein
LDRKKSQDLFLSSIDRGLDAFGPSVRAVVYFELKRLHGILREDIPLKPDSFVATIDQLFGVGATSVSRAISKELEISSGVKGLSEKDLLTALRTAYHELLEK